MTIIDDYRGPGPTALSAPVLTMADRERVLGEWATGVEPCDVLALVTVIRHGHAVPGRRVALRCGSESLTYGELFGALKSGEARPVTAGPSARGIAGLLDEFHAAARAGGGRFGARGLLLDSDALAVTIADRRNVAADRRPYSMDPTRKPADVRLLALPWGDPQLIVDLLAAWSTGATVVVPDERAADDPAALAELIAGYGVTQVVGDAELPGQLAAVGGPLPGVARWDLVGTYCRSTLPAAIRALSPDTVATVSYHVPAYLGAVARGPVTSSGLIRPVPGAKVLVLDEQRQPVAPGVIGEIYVGGRGLAAGFADGTEAERFRDDPFEPGGRLYRTGHRGRWAEGGRLDVESEIDWL